MRDPYTPVRGKCMWWREVPDEGDMRDTTVKSADVGVACTCFVEGKAWVFTTCELPAECPEYKHCRYYIRGV